MGKQRSLGLGIVFLMVVFLVVGVAGTAFAAQPADVGDPLGGVGGVQEVQSLTVTADGGTFQLDYGNGNATPAWNASAAALETDLNSVLPAGSSVAVTGGPGDPTGSTPYTLTFSAASGNVGGPAVNAAGLTLGVGVGTAVVAQIVDGNSGATNVSPHGGYSNQTDYCLQCHKQHGGYGTTPPSGVGGSNYATGAYALLRNYSVTETCNTCHAMYNAGGNAAFDPGVPGLGIGTTSQRSVYENGQPANHASLDETSCAALTGADLPANCTYPVVPKAETAGVYGHKIGYGMSAANLGTGSPVNSTTRYTPNWQYSWNFLPQTSAPANSTTRSGPGTASRLAGGFYCDTCHTPHGADLGYAVNTEKGHPNTPATVTAGSVVSTTWNDDNIIAWHNTTGAAAAGVNNNAWGNVYLNQLAGNSGWQVCQSVDTNCVAATTSNAKDEQVSLYAYQLLTFANHQYQGAGPKTNPNLCSNGLPGSVTPATAADCTAVYGAGITPGFTNTIPAPASYGTTAYGHDKAQWCGTCHSYAVDSSLGGTVHAHPTGCDACHGNTDASITSPGGANGFPDFPHTSEEEFMLTELPDALCINCHTNLP